MAETTPETPLDETLGLAPCYRRAIETGRLALTEHT